MSWANKITYFDREESARRKVYYMAQIHATSKPYLEWLMATFSKSTLM